MATSTNQSGLPDRVIVVAAALTETSHNPDVAAYGRPRFAESRMWSGRPRKARASERRNQFWLSVGRALSYGQGCPTAYEQAVRADIKAARARVPHAA